MNENKIKVVLVEPGKKAVITEIGKSLESMQKVVGGLIEQIMPFPDDVALICNEEGKYNGNKPNMIFAVDNDIDIIFGTFFLVFAPRDSEKFLGMPDDLAEKYEKLLNIPWVYLNWDNDTELPVIKL